MIYSKMFSIFLKYKVKHTYTDEEYEALKSAIVEQFNTDEFKEMLNIISCDYTIKIDKQQANELNAMMIVYATVDTEQELVSQFRRPIKSFIDSHCNRFNNIDAKLIRRRVA